MMCDSHMQPAGNGGEDAGSGAEQERNGGSCHGTDPATGTRGGMVPWLYMHYIIITLIGDDMGSC